MKLQRRGSNRFQGYKNIFDRKVQATWDAERQALLIRVRKVSDKANEFDYDLAIDLDELTGMINVVASDAIEKSSGNVASAFENSLRSLHRLSAVACGVELQKRS